MRSERFEVIVRARAGVNLTSLASCDGPLAVHCGTVGTSIARKVLEGNGVAKVSIEHINLAVDTQSGVEAMMDNFELEHIRSQSPLLFSLISNQAI